jgi:hypothetical protein
MPREFMAAVEYAINSLLRRACSAEDLDGERIQSLLREAQTSSINLDKTTLEFLLRRRIESLAVRFSADPTNYEKLQDLTRSLKIVKELPFPIDMWSAQNHVYDLQDGLFVRTRKRAKRGDLKAQTWVDAYLELSELLSIRPPA